MSLSSTELSSIQQAGVALHHASQSVAHALRAQAQSLVERVTTQPLLEGGELAFTPFRLLAGLSHELGEIEQRMKRLYMEASELQTGKLVSPAKSSRRRAGVRPARARAMSLDAPVHLSPNDLKVLTYMRNTLNSTDWLPLTGAVVAAGAGLPKGSVGISITRVLASGAVRRGEGGTYQLVEQ